MEKQSLFDAVGGLPTLQQVHRIFYDKVYADPWLGSFFAGHEQAAIENRQTEFMAEKMGSVEKYPGKPLRQVHENMYISGELVALRTTLLRASLAEAGVYDGLAERWLRIDTAFAKQVVKSSVAEFYRDYSFAYKQRIIHPKPQS